MPSTTPITVAHGDGIGPEIMAAVLATLSAAGADLNIETIEIGEQVYLRQRQLEAWLMKPLTAKTVEAAVCQGARWLLTGRLKASQGAGALFAARADVSQVTLVFYGVETRVDPDRSGRYRQRRTVEPHARFTVSRERAQQLSLDALTAQLEGPDCGQAARVVLDEVWVKKVR